MSQASSYNYENSPWVRSILQLESERLFIPSTASTHKVPAYNLTRASNAHVSGLCSEYSVAAIAKADDNDSSDGTDDQSEEDDGPQAEVEQGVDEGTDGSGSDSSDSSDSSDEISEDVTRLAIQDEEGEGSDNSDSGSGDAENTDEENDEAVARADQEDDDDDQPPMPTSILKTGPSTRRKSVVMIAPDFSAPETDPGYYKAQAKADKQILKKKWFVSGSEAREQEAALARVKDRKKRWSAHEAASTGSGTMSSGTARPDPQPTGSEKDSRTTTTIARTTSGKSGKSVDLPRRAFVKRK